MTSLCGICTKPNTIFSENLSCGHKAHKKCFKETIKGKIHKCRVCRNNFLSAKDKKILSTKDTKSLNKTIAKYGPSYNTTQILRATKNQTIKTFVVNSGFNIEEALKEEIENKNLEGVKFLLQAPTINFHATFNRQTLLEIALGLGIEGIIDAISQKMGIGKKAS